MQLSDYLASKGLGIQEFADQLGVSPVTVYRYLRGDRWPAYEMLQRIHVATKGKVTPNDFFASPKEAARAA